MKKKVVVATAAVLLAGALLLPASENPTEQETPKLEYSPMPEEEQIILNGMVKLDFAADEMVQKVDFQNENENCRIRIILSLSNGEQIYESELLNPGENIATIKLSRKIDRGIYSNCTLKYECFSLEDEALNSASFNVEIAAY